MARRPVRAPRPRGLRTDLLGWLRGLRLSGFSFVMLGILALGVVVLSPTVHTLVQERQKIATLQDQLQAQRDRIHDKKQQLARWDDPSYIRAQARQRLLYVMPGDTSYLVLDDRPEAQKSADDGPAPSQRIRTTPTDWLSTLFGSVVTAGLTDAPADELPTDTAPADTRAER